MIYEDENGQQFEGRTAKDVVRSMARTKLTKSTTRAAYRRGTARRIESMTGLTVAHRTDNIFLKSLVEAKLLKLID